MLHIKKEKKYFYVLRIIIPLTNSQLLTYAVKSLDYFTIRKHRVFVLA